jgi:hypothetical protein
VKKYLSIDCESAGLNGDTFAFGWCIVDESGFEHEAGSASSGVNSVEFDSSKNRRWIEENVPREYLYPEGSKWLSRGELKDLFKLVIKRAEEDGTQVIVDCGYPVEARFLLECDCAVYPLMELSTALMMAGKDPMGIYPRLPNELPKHDPLADARQSARLWLECVHPE